ncbi:hypothetical protein ZWY2020_013198 [Hordeum vulgare]|nr:hypothetical protein ZWY2020_013198 [Hordeum vulgare]
MKSPRPALVKVMGSKEIHGTEDGGRKASDSCSRPQEVAQGSAAVPAGMPTTKPAEASRQQPRGRMMDAASIAWLVQTILSTLLIDKLDEWIRQVGLADDVEKLKLEIRTVKVVVSAVKGGAIGNEPLAKSLAILKELLYDGDDLVDELDYYRLQQQVQADPGVLVPSNFAVQGVTSDEPEVMAIAGRVDEMSRGGDDDAQDNSVRKLRVN